MFLKTVKPAQRARVSSIQRTLNANLLEPRNIEEDILSTSILEEKQRELKMHLTDYCRANKHKRGLPSLSRFQVIESPPIVFCMVPKVASRMWRAIFKQLRLHIEQQRANLDQYNATDICHYLVKSYKFMFVREPFERLLSAYKDKFVSTRAVDRYILDTYGRNIIRKYRPNATQQALQDGNDVTFPEFIEYILKDGIHEGLNWHWNTFEDQCRPCSVEYNFIGRFEYLSQDAKYALKKAGVYNLTHDQFPSTINNNYSRTRYELIKYYSQIPLEWIVQLGRVYRSSFEMFGYPFPGPLEELFHNTTGQTGITGKTGQSG
ncbi:hypothetical protein OS493_025842 [Desmophyllum pertusum]|uniref:Carbohydrate sulfotransferase n=1 Tax=Desmophyllum pertusum TaxID=174260 RepID=A0A9W9YXW8_9CNID|nr:hypothetical protein OS493_025842 [Desmophyllum pertusum]